MKKLILYCLCLIGLVTGFYFLLRSGTKVGSDRYQVGEEMKISRSPDLPVPALCGYQTEFAVPSGEEDVNADGFSKSCPVFIMVDNETKNVVAAKNVYRRIYPASTTKIMTAILVLDAVEEGKFGLNDVITLQHDTVVEDPDAVASDLNEGCSITVRNLLHGLLIRSYNDYAIILSELVAGSESDFVDLMNAKAEEFGMTGTHYENPHGLHDPGHYTTAYDMYILMRKASAYPLIEEIDQNHSYTYEYTNAAGETLTDDISPTNMYLSGNAELPSNIRIQEWKTGTTSQAGHVLTMNCLIDDGEYTIYCAEYDDTEELYSDYSMLFNLR